MPPLSLMIKPASSLCNLSCEYCFYKDVSEHREHLGFGVMEKETAEVLIEKALKYADSENVSFAFQGGEPTIAGLDFFKFFVETVKEKNVKNLIVAGGVAANKGLREKLEELCEKNNISLTIPPVKYCTDNAAMIGVAGYYAYKLGKTSDLDLNAKASLKLQ